METAPYVCHTCSEPLDAIFTQHGVSFFHALDSNEVDHDVVPVIQTEDWRGSCDLCGTKPASHELPCADFQLPGLPGYVSRGDWLLCSVCALWVQHDEWSKINERARERHASGLNASLVAGLHWAVRDHARGAVRAL